MKMILISVNQNIDFSKSKSMSPTHNQLSQVNFINGQRHWLNSPQIIWSAESRSSANVLQWKKSVMQYFGCPHEWTMSPFLTYERSPKDFFSFLFGPIDLTILIGRICFGSICVILTLLQCWCFFSKGTIVPFLPFLIDESFPKNSFVAIWHNFRDFTLCQYWWYLNNLSF